MYCKLGTQGGEGTKKNEKRNELRSSGMHGLNKTEWIAGGEALRGIGIKYNEGRKRLIAPLILIRHGRRLSHVAVNTRTSMSRTTTKANKEHMF